ncbi:hypothetical protein [Rickettsia endosymbiont of Orchestes rusci]|uniref:hypothetical protein n=1 Tax=Rickettsia endosymbiont of Orchestes rusci TaxID=3066250 RepID=UPI00313CA2F5
MARKTRHCEEGRSPDAAIQKNIVILNLFQDLLKKDAQNLFSMTRTGLPRRHKCLLAMTNNRFPPLARMTLKAKIKVKIYK